MNEDLFLSDKRRRLTLRKGKERVVSNRHPWIFAGAIGRESGPAEAAIADLYDESGALLASGLYSTHSQIRLRALTFGDAPLTAATLRARLIAAAERRRPLFDEGTNAGRIVHAEGDDLSGLVVDRYGDVLVAEVANAGLDRLRPLIEEVLREVLAPRGIYFKNDLPARKLEQLSLESEWVGDGEPAAEIVEHGLRFHVDPHGGQKTGFFVDQRDNRQLARTLAAERTVLNLFGYTGAFGVYAAAGGASAVHNVDISESAISMARTNHELNGVHGEFTVADAFSFVREQSSSRRQYDLVICDPPAFAKSRHDVDRAARGYKDINLYSMRLTKPGGLLMTYSCSGHMDLDLFQKIVFSAALDTGRRASFIQRLTAGADHPVSIYCPEGEYLKGFLLRVE
jgi:23S rRNA (cytosine1962-C5)-methyltransferase